MNAHRNATARRRWKTIALMAVACAALYPAEAARAAIGELVLVADTGKQDFGEVDSIRHRPAISADGRFVAYVSQSSAEGDPLFLRDLRRGETTQVVWPSEVESTWGFDTETPVLSADGRYLAFASEDPDVSSEDVDSLRGATGTHPVQDVFVYDRMTGKTKLISRDSGRRGRPADGNSSRPSISDDGRHVAYVTDASNLAPPGPPIPGGVYGRDLRSEANRLISGAPGIMFWHPASFWPDVSGDGRRVAFGFQYSRTAYDPKHPPRNIARWLHRRHKQIMLADPKWKRPRVVSRASGPRGALANLNCNEPSSSGSGRFVAFTSEAANLVPGDDNGVEDVFVRDVRRRVTTLVSRRATHGAPGNAESSRPSISGDGRYVAFQSLAGNLAPGDGDDDSDVFVKDLRTGRVTLVSRGLGGEPSNGRFGAPTITPDGRFLAFGSTSSNVSPEVTTHQMAFYRFQLRR